MRNHAIVALANDDGAYSSISVRLDGPIGAVLRRHYATREKAEQLVELGDLFMLGEEIGEKHDGQWLSKAVVKNVLDSLHGTDAELHATPQERYCNAFGRDWGEAGHEAKRHDFRSLVRASRKQGAQRLFVFDGRWKSVNLHSQKNVTVRSLRPVRA